MMKGNALATSSGGKITPRVMLKASMEACTSIARSKLAWRVIEYPRYDDGEYDGGEREQGYAFDATATGGPAQDGTRNSGRCQSVGDPDVRVTAMSIASLECDVLCLCVLPLRSTQ
jgi:hypothetical protein